MKGKIYLEMILLIVLIVVLLLAGCKKDDDGTLAKIKQRNEIVVGTEAAFPPFEFVEEDKIVGYGADILSEISTNQGWQVNQLDVPFSGIFTGLENKKFDLVATSISVNPERKEKFGLTMPIADFTQVLVKLKNNDDIQSLEDIDGKIIGCPVGSSAEKELLEYSQKLKDDGGVGLEVKVYQANTDTFIDLKNGRIDMIFPVLPMANMLMKEEPNTYEIVSTFGQKSYMSWAVRKEDEDLLKLINEEILQMKKSGKLKELQEKWFGTSWDLPDELP